MSDLITLASIQANTALAIPTGVDAGTIAAKITQASKAIQRYCQRDFVRTIYDELYNGLGYSELILRQFPVNGVLRLAANLQVVMSVINLDRTNLIATAALTTTGDTVTGLAVTGFSLIRVASGVSATSPILFTGLHTIANAVAAVNAVGNGWSATATAGYEQWPVANLVAPQGVQNCSTSQGGAGAIFQDHVTNLTGWTINARQGRLQLNNQTWDPVFSLMSLAGSPSLSTFPPGFQNVRCQYDAGYQTVPEDVQYACELTVQDMIWRQRVVRQYQSETTDKWSYTLGPINKFGIPEDALRILHGWRAFRSAT